MTLRYCLIQKIIIYPLVVGDELIIKYTCEFKVQEIYSLKFIVIELTIYSIEVIGADIVGFRVSGNDDMSSVFVEFKYNNCKILMLEM